MCFSLNQKDSKVDSVQVISPRVHERKCVCVLRSIAQIQGSLCMCLLYTRLVYLLLRTFFCLFSFSGEIYPALNKLVKHKQVQPAIPLLEALPCAQLPVSGLEWRLITPGCQKMYACDLYSSSVIGIY